MPSRVGTTMTGKPEVRQWLNDHVSGHWYFFTNQESKDLWIAFANKSDALLWKLTWH
jgi:hypothetical protein